MAPGSEIRVQSGSKLTIHNGTNLIVCDQMWKGIHVEPGATLEVKNSTIEDALYAIRAYGNATVSVTNSVFNRNYIGMYIGETGYPALTTIGEFHGNTFDGQTLLPIFPGAVSPTPPATVGSKAYAGLYVHRPSNMVHSLENTFKDMSLGIYAKSTDVKISKNFFENIWENGYDPYLTGKAVFVSGSSNTLQMTGHGPGQLTISSCSNGVHVDNSRVDYINNCSMSVQNKGIDLYGNKSEVTVHDNTIRTFTGDGISMNFPDPNATIYIVNNNINLYGAGTTGIRHSSFGATGGQFNIVWDNIINLEANQTRGISFNGSSGINVFDNNVYFGTGLTNLRGISLENDLGSHLSCNLVDGNGLTLNSRNIGLRVLAGEATTYKCNLLQDNEFGAIISMGSSSPEGFQETNLPANRIGLRLDATSTMGTQTHRGNLWSGTPIGGVGAQHLSNNNIDWDLSKFTVHTNAAPYYPILPAGQSAWFDVISGTPPMTCAGQTCIDPLFAPGITELESDIANNLLQTSAYNAEMGWLGKRYLYRKLVANPSLMPPGSVFAAFHNTVAVGNIGAFHSVEAGMSEVFKMNASTTAQLATNYATLSAEMEEVGVIDSLLRIGSNNPGLPQQRADALVALGALAQSSTALVDGALAQQVSEADAVNTQNGAIAASNLYESNDKLVNTIFLNTVAMDILEFDAGQKASLLAVANQCPYSGGTAVFKARSLLALVENLTFDDEQLCNSGQLPLQRPRPTEAASALGLFPNPATQQVVATFASGMVTGGRLTIHDAFGKEAMAVDIAPGSTTHLLDVGGLTNGMYLCTLFEGGRETASQKLVILK